MSKPPPAPMTTEPPLAAQLRSPEARAQAILPAFVIFEKSPAVGFVYTAFAGRVSDRMVCPSVNVAAAVPLFPTVSVQVNPDATVMVPAVLLVLVTTKSGDIRV